MDNQSCGDFSKGPGRAVPDRRSRTLTVGNTRCELVKQPQFFVNSTLTTAVRNYGPIMVH